MVKLNWLIPPERVSRVHRARRDRSAFRELVATPLSGTLTLPANGQFSVRSLPGCAEGTPCCTIGARDIASRSLEAGEVMGLGWFERGTTITVLAGFELLLDMGLGRYKVVCTEGAL